MTYAWFEQYAEEAWGLVNTLWLKSTGTSPSGLDLAQLLTVIGQTPPAPTPTPAPTPAPTPTPPPAPVPDVAIYRSSHPAHAAHGITVGVDRTGPQVIFQPHLKTILLPRGWSAR